VTNYSTSTDHLVELSKQKQHAEKSAMCFVYEVT